MTVRIHTGLPGSGKSYAARELLGSPGTGFPHREIFSTDDFFMKEGIYQFDPKKLSEAHAWNLRRYTDAVRTGSAVGAQVLALLIVDNTNLSVAEVAPYAALALAYGHELNIVTYECPVSICVERNTHKVPGELLLKMEKTLSERKLPPWWPNETVRWNGGRS